ncbi:MAG: sugar ABC transporter ATP-binding protein, partial [Desulforhabdus sp.]|nr:sugar ABC transporter ATP-binding protein [Desulforhabdus sp.]
MSSAEGNSPFVIEMRGISKSFGSVKALDDVTLRVARGEVHGLVGENGAGKSTLMKILAGLHMPDSGEIVREGKVCAWKNPSDSIASGVAMIYQELSLAPDLSVAENIWLGIEPSGKIFGTYSKKKMLEDTRALAEKHGFSLDPNEKVENLPASACQIVETLKAIAWNAQILVMDEPTSSCGEQEVAVILGMVRRLQRSGTTIIYISHRLEEVVKVAENVTVLRDGRVEHTGPINNLKIVDIVTHMVGRDLERYFPKRNVDIGSTVLRVLGLSSRSVRDIDFDLCSGEIVGVAGLVGSGRTELARVLCGVDQPVSGSVELDGQ